MTIELVREQLMKLNLKTASMDLDDILGKKKRAIDLKWLSELFERELDARKDNAIERRIKKANFQREPVLSSSIGALIKSFPKNKWKLFII